MNSYLPRGATIKAQSKTASVIESLANILAGVGIALVSQILIFGHYGVHVTLAQNLQMTGWFTAVSIVRSYVLRRVFNSFTERKLPSPRWNNLTRDGRMQ